MDADSSISVPAPRTSSVVSDQAVPRTADLVDLAAECDTITLEGIERDQESSESLTDRLRGCAEYSPALVTLVAGALMVRTWLDMRAWLAAAVQQHAPMGALGTQPSTVLLADGGWLLTLVLMVASTIRLIRIQSGVIMANRRLRRDAGTRRGTNGRESLNPYYNIEPRPVPAPGLGLAIFVAGSAYAWAHWGAPVARHSAWLTTATPIGTVADPVAAIGHLTWGLAGITLGYALVQRLARFASTD